jgi:hypothetical protein
MLLLLLLLLLLLPQGCIPGQHHQQRDCRGFCP